MAKAAGETLVLVTGASGYIASHVVKLLLDRGYRVRGTVRSLKNAEKVAPIRKLDVGGRLELVEADLTSDKGWKEAVAGCDYIQHVASPFPLVPDETTIPTAIDGTLNVLKAASKAHSVKKVVLTSSCAAVSDGLPPNRVFNEDDWTDVDKKSVGIYPRSKTLAERAAWKFVKELKKDDNKFKLTTINPVLVVGPPLIDIQGSSVTIVKQFLQNEMPALPPIQIGMVDVRDVAEMHVEAMIRPEADGHRFISASMPEFWFKEIATLLDTEFKPHGYKLPWMVAPAFAVRILSCFDGQAASIVGRLNIEEKYDNTKAQRILGTKFRDPKESLIEMGYILIERGIVKRTKDYKGCPKKYSEYLN